MFNEWKQKLNFSNDIITTKKLLRHYPAIVLVCCHPTEPSDE